MQKNNFRYLEKLLTDTSLENSFTKEDIVAYKEAWGQERALPCLLNWYKALIRRSLKLDKSNVSVQTLILWGKKDNFLKWEIGDASLKYCDYGRLE